MIKNRLRFVIILTLLIASLSLVGTVGAAPKDGPVVSLGSTQIKYNSLENVIITVAISNPTKHSVRILKWYTPIDGLEEPILTIKVDGAPVAYTGAIYKRPSPTGNDYILLKSGEGVVYDVNIGDFYDLSTSGQYEIFYSVASYNLYNEKGNSSKIVDSLVSEPIHLKVEGRVPKGKPTPPPPPSPGESAFNACSLTQQSILLDARAQASSYASESENYLFGIKSGTPRYLEWFGAFTSSRFSTVQSHFTSISNAWDNAGVNFDCKCKQNYYAYVYPDRPYFIYLCKVFWLAPLTGTDSQAGTLIHEMSHFTVVANTDDYVYGQSGARDLADTEPDYAVMNADNHEYFAENHPYLE